MRACIDGVVMGDYAWMHGVLGVTGCTCSLSLKKLDEGRDTSSPVASPIPLSDIIGPLQSGGLGTLKDGVFSTYDDPLPNGLDGSCC